jgi:hypothetical protein
MTIHRTWIFSLSEENMEDYLFYRRQLFNQSMNWKHDVKVLLFELYDGTYKQIFGLIKQNIYKSFYEVVNYSNGSFVLRIPDNVVETLKRYSMIRKKYQPDTCFKVSYKFPSGLDVDYILRRV